MSGTAAGRAGARDPIESLLEEHREIMARLMPLRAAIRDLRARGTGALAEALPALREAGHMMETRLHRHARQEDEALFPAIERALGTIGGPTAVMREEHRAIHERALRFRETVRELHEVEHPAIESGGERLRALAGGGGDPGTLADAAEMVTLLLDLHFAKEEDILFPMAREVLPEEELRRVAAGMASIAEEAEFQR